MAESETKKLLKEAPLFSQFSGDELASVTETAVERTFAAGQKIVTEGDVGGIGFYLILAGAVEVRKGERTLAKLGSGQFFGEMALLLDKETPRSADVVATAETRCLMITRWDLRSLVKTHPEMALKMMGELARRLSKTHESLSE